ncbi:MAG: Rid family detoxifying hydrolase [Clostridiales Family XIII bacterium]|jgi:2-iminobutanoate/2-iminopropanoate deaminase|nr:Rid family detoxifying hydrolase [Clostridiales Family XIII bacterium]
MAEHLHTDKAPAAVGPYSQAVKANGFLFPCGQLGLVPETGELAGPDVASQAEQSFKNLIAVLENAGLTEANVVKATVYFADMGDFDEVNKIYARYFPSKPARTGVAVKTLPKNALIETEIIAAYE